MSDTFFGTFPTTLPCDVLLENKTFLKTSWLLTNPSWKVNICLYLGEPNENENKTHKQKGYFVGQNEKKGF